MQLNLFSEKKLLNLFFIILSIGYLLVELTFNGQLLLLTEDFSEEKLRNLEIIGRAVSATGFALLLSNFVLNRVFDKHLKETLIQIFIITFVFSWIFMFYGQKLLVESVVDKTTIEEKQKAYSVNIMQQGLLNGGLTFNNLPYEDISNTDDKVFAMLFTGLLYASDTNYKKLNDNIDYIVKDVVDIDVDNNKEELFNSYVELGNNIKEKYNDYRKLSNDFNNSISDKKLKEKAVEINNEILNNISSKVNSYNSALNRIENEVEEKYQEFLPTYRDLTKQWRNGERSCMRGKKLCKNAIMIDLRAALRRVGSPFSAESLFPFTDTKLKEAIRNKIYSRAKMSIYSKPKSFNKTKNEVSTKREVVRKLNARYRLDINADSFNYNSNTIFIALKKRAKIESKKEWNEKSNIPPNLNLSQFLETKEVKSFIEDNFSIEINRLDLNKKEFNLKLLNKIKNNATEDNLKIVNSDSDTFLKEYSENGREAVKSIFIPQIAMVISLIFFFITAIKIIVSFISLFVKELSIKKGLILFSIYPILISTILLYSLTIKNKYIENDNIQSVLNSNNELYNFIIEFALRVQPIIAELSYKVDNTLNISKLLGL